MKTSLRANLLTLTLLISISLTAQEFTAGINTETPNPNAVLHLVAPNGNQGLLVPSITTVQRNGMNSTLTATDNGLMVFDSDENAFYFWVNPNWVETTNTDNQNLANVLNQGNDAGGVAITNVADPVAAQDVATKNYVDTQSESDPTVPANIKDGVDFTELTGIPANIDLDQTDDIALNTAPALGDIEGDYQSGLNIAIGVVSSLEIADGTITNVDINDVDVSKITGAPNLDLDASDDVATTTNPTAADVSGSFSSGFIVDQVGGETSTDIASAVAIVNGATNLDLDASDDLIAGDNITLLTNDAGFLTAETDPTVPANIKDGIDWSELTGIPAGFADDTDDGIVTELDPVWLGDRATIGSAGVINTPANLLDWSQLKNVPAGIADGVDDGVVTETDPTVPANIKDGIDWSELTGIPAGFADDTDDGIVTELDPVWLGDRATIGSAGVINTPANLLDWSQLKNVPAGIADGVDDGVVTETDPTVPANIKDGIDWSELTGIPAGFADDTDDGIVTELDPVWLGDRATIGSAGVINTPANLLDWSQLKNVPAGIADGVDDLTLPFLGSFADGGSLFDIEQTGAGRAGLFRVTNPGHNSPALEVRSNGDGATSYLARFDRVGGSTGSGVFYDMNGVNNPAILIDNTTAPIQIFDGANIGYVLTSDAAGIGTWQQNFGSVIGSFNLVTQMAGTGGALSTGADNVLLGRTVGGAITTGNENILIGNQVATGLTTAGGNISIGIQSGGTNMVSGGDNIVIGTRAILAGGPTNSTNNIAIGTDAQATLSATAIGSDARATAPGSVAIGTGARATSLNTVTLGDAAGTRYSLEVTGNLVSSVSNVAAAAAEGFTPLSRIITLEASANITNIAAGTAGQEIILVTLSDAAVNEGGNIDLATPSFNPGNPNSTLHLVYIGSMWVEISRTLK